MHTGTLITELMEVVARAEEHVHAQHAEALPAAEAPAGVLYQLEHRDEILAGVA